MVLERQSAPLHQNRGNAFVQYPRMHLHMCVCMYACMHASDAAAVTLLAPGASAHLCLHPGAAHTCEHGCFLWHRCLLCRSPKWSSASHGLLQPGISHV